jgi:hypothetical protein
MANMIKVNLDIAGFYYQRENIEVPHDATIKDIMQKAVDLDISEKRKMRLDFQGSTRTKGDEFLTRLSVTHFQEAQSRQRVLDDKNNKILRYYEAGLYIGIDDDVMLPPQMTSSPKVNGLIPVDPMLKQVKAWQYYVYSRTFVDKNRALGGGGASSPHRMIIPFSSKNQPLEDKDTIVWRLVTIAVKPDLPLSDAVA